MTPQQATDRDLLDSDGENRALRTFLMQYGLPGLTVAAMGQHMNRSGWGSEYWPDFARKVDNAGQYLTKAGAQIWIRHLLSLESRAPAPTEPAVHRDALESLYHALPDVLPAGAYARFRDTGKWATDTAYALRGHTGTLEYRADDMEAVYAAVDAATAALATPASPAVPEPTMPCWSCKKPYTAEQRLYADGRCPHCEVDIELDDDDAVQAVPAPAPLAPIPDVLFDGHAVYKSVMENDPHTPRPTADNISDVLDAVVRLLRASQPTSAPEAVSLLVEEAKRVIGKN